MFVVRQEWKGELTGNMPLYHSNKSSRLCFCYVLLGDWLNKPLRAEVFGGLVPMPYRRSVGTYLKVLK